MSAVAAAIVGGAVIGAVVTSQASDKATEAQERASQAGIKAQEEALSAAERRTQPFADVGLSAADPLQRLLGIQTPGQEGGIDPQSQIEEINPVLSFLRDEGFEDIQESAAARGRLGAGGTLKDLTRFNTQLGATVVPQMQQQRFNQLFDVLRLGSNVSAGQATAGIQTAGNTSNLLGAIGQSQAQNQLRQGDIQAGFASDLTGILGAQQGGAFRQPPPQQTFGSADTTNPNRFEAFS